MGKSEEKKEVDSLEIKVSLFCENCAKDVKKALWKVKGVKNVMVDLEKGRANIKGSKIQPDAVLKILKKKLKKDAEIIPPPKPPQEKVAPPSNNNVAAHVPAVCVINGQYYYTQFPHYPVVANGPPVWAHHYPCNYENDPDPCSIL
ncbi:unnamed protein product [Cuscuta campestris]|uniref:HMA domain-containing protein n=1 Tax=Cuscuta campestris TaxID=132261 RepID=A0A484KAT2_9ASTE|nr:unnamed protein product [Cuscuta campestris]